MAKNTEELRNVCVSDGTMRTEDLFPKMYWVLKEYAPEKAKEFAEFAEDDSWMGERGSHVMGKLFYALDEIAPEGCYFGSQEGDGACYGFWEVEEESCKRRGRMLRESKADKVYYIKQPYRNKNLYFKGTLSELIDKFGYTLMKGHRENSRINTNPTTFKGLISNINKAVDATEGGYDRNYVYPATAEEVSANESVRRPRGRMLKESYFDCYEYTLEKAKETIKNFDSDAHGFDAIGEPVVFENSIRQSYISDLISLVYSGNATDEELKQFNSYKEDWKKEYRKYAEEHGLDPEDTSSDVAEEHFDSWMSDVQVEREIVFNWGHDHEEDRDDVVDVVGFYIEGLAFNVWLELRDEEKECSKEQIDRFFRIFSNKLANLDRNSGGSPLTDINDLAESRRPSRRGRMIREGRGCSRRRMMKVGRGPKPQGRGRR